MNFSIPAILLPAAPSLAIVVAIISVESSLEGRLPYHMVSPFRSVTDQQILQIYLINGCDIVWIVIVWSSIFNKNKDETHECSYLAHSFKDYSTLKDNHKLRLQGVYDFWPLSNLHCLKFTT